MTALSFSVIVVSRGRPDALMRCLTGLEQLDHTDFEIIVVADPEGMAQLEGSRFAGRIKAVEFDKPNISQSRNLGLTLAAGEIVAFIDDDAVPEPTWLTHLTAPFVVDNVIAAGGFVRGRNGISFQNRARYVAATGEHTEIVFEDEAPQVFAGRLGWAVKTEGTNCAFRREALCEMGGFDPAFAFFMDETDVNLRLSATGARTAIVPLAQVQHGFAASAHRLANRMPRSLFDVGASQVILLRKHASDIDRAPVLDRLRAEQRARLVRHMIAGTCEPRDLRRVLATLEAGIAAGQMRAFGNLTSLGAARRPFLRFEPMRPFSGSTVISGRIWHAARLRRKAARAVEGGLRVSLFLFGPSAVYHQVAFKRDGVWEQKGGLWGKAERSEPLFRRYSVAERTLQESCRIRSVRGLTKCDKSFNMAQQSG